MKLAVVANEPLKQEFLSKKITAGVNLCFVTDPQNIPADTDAVFDLLFEPAAQRIAQLKKFFPRPVFINAVTDTLGAIGGPFIRINAWPTFLKREIAEVALLPEQQQVMQRVFEQLGWLYKVVPDLPGMISAGIICKVINEAYFTLGENVSTREEIDIAMKLGTHYPYGPFEWGRRIGLKKIYALLIQLNKENKLQEVSALLTEESDR